VTQIGRYRLDRVLGSGSFATVWKGYDVDLDIPVAIKLLADNWSRDADVRERFLTEARLLRRIASERVVRVHDVGVTDDQPYFVMDYVEGGSLADRVGSLDPREALRLTVEAAHAVQVLHDAGVVHRDVKPANLLVDDTSLPQRVLVADLGSAKMLADASGFTVTTGTPAYMAPEQAASAGFDGRADVYALAVVGYELVCGRRPYDSAGWPLVPAGPGSAPAPIAAAHWLPQEVDTVLAAALQQNPSARPENAGTLAALLAAAGADRDPEAPRRDWPVGVVAAVALLLFVLSAAVAWALG
jgi:serine/threonine protein kinase